MTRMARSGGAGVVVIATCAAVLHVAAAAPPPTPTGPFTYACPPLPAYVRPMGLPGTLTYPAGNLASAAFDTAAGALMCSYTAAAGAALQYVQALPATNCMNPGGQPLVSCPGKPDIQLPGNLPLLRNVAVGESLATYLSTTFTSVKLATSGGTATATVDYAAPGNFASVLVSTRQPPYVCRVLDSARGVVRCDPPLR